MVLLSIPLWFFGVDFAIYGICSLFAFLVSYFAYNISQVSGKKAHFNLYLSFALLGAGMFAVSLSSLMIFIQPALGELTPFDMFSGLDDLGYWVYYLTSIVAYSLLSYTYMSEGRFKSFAPIIFPAWPLVYTHFNLIAIFLLSFTVFRMIINFINRKSLNSLLILSGFSLISLHHLLILFMPFTNIIYLLSHMLLILGFSMMVLVLKRVGR